MNLRKMIEEKNVKGLITRANRARLIKSFNFRSVDVRGKDSNQTENITSIVK